MPFDAMEDDPNGVPFRMPIEGESHDEGIADPLRFGALPATSDLKTPLLNDLQAVLRLIEHKADQGLQGQYTEKLMLGIILTAARKALVQIEALRAISDGYTQEAARSSYCESPADGEESESLLDFMDSLQGGDFEFDPPKI